MRLTNAAVPTALIEHDSAHDHAHDSAADLTLCEVVLDGERVAAVTPSVGVAPDPAMEPGFDCEGGILMPAFVDMHTHLDKGHIWPRTPNPDGTFHGALSATGDDRAAHWHADDVARRMDFALQAAYAHGTRAIRTHIDTVPAQDAISWPVFRDMKAAWRDRITLQGVSLTGVGELPDDLNPLFDHVTAHGGIVGAVLYNVPEMPARVSALLQEAENRSLDIDFHVDETLDPSSDCLRHVADAAVRIGFSGQITCGHCCSLMTMAESAADRVLDAVARAGIAIVSLPLCNLYLQDRQAGRTPRIRGGTLVHEMHARGIPVAVASDNTRDPFYAYGDLDMAEVWREATRLLHLDHPVGDWPRAVTATPASVMGLPDHGIIRPGSAADLVLFRARSWTELFARPQTDRTVIRSGVMIDATLPHYRDLDDLWISLR